jgi:hypothetical protein
VDRGSVVKDPSKIKTSSVTRSQRQDMSRKRFSTLLKWKPVISRVCRTCYVIPFVSCIRMTVTNAPCQDKNGYDCEGSTCKYCFTIESLTPCSPPEESPKYDHSFHPNSAANTINNVQHRQQHQKRHQGRRERHPWRRRSHLRHLQSSRRHSIRRQGRRGREQSSH